LKTYSVNQKKAQQPEGAKNTAGLQHRLEDFWIGLDERRSDTQREITPLNCQVTLLEQAKHLSAVVTLHTKWDTMTVDLTMVKAIARLSES
jgi:hypothetical protein